MECTESRSKPKGLSVKTVRNINQMISSALNCAVEQRLIPANPTKGCVLPKLERKEMKILPPESLGTFFEEARRSGVFELYYIDLATGLRWGELLGLKWAGLERIRFHDLRHTFSVLAPQNGVDVKTLSAMLGHYSAGFTLDTYAHVTTSMQKQAANAVGSFLSGTLQP